MQRLEKLFQKLWHGADYNYEQWLDYPQILADDFSLMRLAQCNVMSVGIFSWVKLEPEEGYFEFAWLDQLMDTLAENDIVAMAGSLKTGTVRPSQLMPIFSSAAASSLAKAIQDLGRLAKTLYMLHYLPDETYQHRILTQLNHTELRHKLARRLCYGHRGELRHSYKEGQEEQLGALGLVLSLIVYWNTYYLDQALTELQVKEPDLPIEDVDRITPLAYEAQR